MELVMHPTSLATLSKSTINDIDKYGFLLSSFHGSFGGTTVPTHFSLYGGRFLFSTCSNQDKVKSQLQGRRLSTVTSALPETAASVAVTATLVGAAVTLLVKRTKTPEVTEIQFRVCEDCSGTGICSECNGEGFVLKKLSEENAERARKLSKNMATRFTAGLPKKWSYCTKCSSGRSCSTCGGTGKLSY